VLLLTLSLTPLLVLLAPGPHTCLQGTLLFALLLLAIWAPLLLFSSGAPTYQTPGVASVSFNASLGVVTRYGGFEGAATFPVYSAGSRRSIQDWGTTAPQGGSNSSDGSDSGGGDGGRLGIISNGNRQLRTGVTIKHALRGKGGGDSGGDSGGGDDGDDGPDGGNMWPPLPPWLAGYSADQIKLLCLSQVWLRHIVTLMSFRIHCLQHKKQSAVLQMNMPHSQWNPQ
jgi:Piezo non-specific cation channel, R-Ras-binding domain